MEPLARDHGDGCERMRDRLGRARVDAMGVPTTVVVEVIAIVTRGRDAGVEQPDDPNRRHIARARAARVVAPAGVDAALAAAAGICVAAAEFWRWALDGYAPRVAFGGVARRTDFAADIDEVPL